MTKYYFLVVVILSIFGSNVALKAEAVKKDNPSDLTSMKFSVDENGNGIPDDEEEDPDSKDALGD